MQSFSAKIEKLETALACQNQHSCAALSIFGQQTSCSFCSSADASYSVSSYVFPLQVHQPVMSSHDRSGGGSLRRQPTYPPAGPSHSYRLHEASLFSSAPNLYAYPASAALASVSQAVDQLHNSAGSSSSSSSSSSIRHTRAAGPYSASLSLLQKSSAMGLMGQSAASHCQQQQLPGQPYPLSQRKLNQYPYLWGTRSPSRATLVWNIIIVGFLNHYVNISFVFMS